MTELKTLEIVDGLMTIEELSQYLKIPKSTIYGLTMRAKVPHFHVGRLLRFKKGDIDTWLENSGCDGKGHES